MSPPRPVRAIAFDLFHTLVDPEEFRPKEFLRYREIARLLQLPLAEFERFWIETEKPRQLTRVPNTTERVRQFCIEHGISPPAEGWSRVAEIVGRYARLAIARPRDRIVDSLRDLRERGVVLGLLSNCEGGEIDTWPRSPLAGFFDATVFSCDVGFAKPSIEAYRALVPRWGDVPLKAAAFVGDGANDELPGARRAGFRVAIFDSEFVAQNGLRRPEANDRIRRDGDATIQTLAELPVLLGL